VVLVLPGAAVPGGLGQVLTGLVAAGAFAAFLSTSSGLLVSVSGVLSTDVFGNGPARNGSVRDFRRAAMLAGVVPLALALRVHDLDVSQVVGLAFAVAASSFCPLLVLGIWWSRLTAPGAIVGMVVGLVSSAGVIGLGFFLAPPPGLVAILLGQPALWSVPLAFVTMVLVSLGGRPPAWANAAMLRLHLDETERGRR